MEKVRTKRFAFRPVVCQECGFIIHKQSYVEVDHKNYHLKCENKTEKGES